MLNKLLNLKSKLVPLLFGIVIVTSFMYIYDDSLTSVFFVCSLVLQTVVYIFYDYVSTKGRILQYVSILGSMAVMLLLLIAVGSLYSTQNIIDFMVWFLSPQSVVEYSSQYNLVMLIGLNLFISSTIYYFTQVRYRMVTTFLLMLIPFAIFIKESQDIPIPFLLSLIVLYFATLVVCGQNNIYIQRNLKVVENKSYAQSIGAFVLTFMIVSSVAPKPEITADTDTFENLITANNLTDYLLAQLGNFTDTSNGTGVSLSNSKVTLFNAETSETVTFKSRTFSEYNYNQNVWLRADGITTTLEQSPLNTTLDYGDRQSDLVNYDRYGDMLNSQYVDDFKQSLDPAQLLNAIVYACGQDTAFAEKYRLTNIDLDHTFSTPIKTAKFTTSDNRGTNMSFNSSAILSPTNTFQVFPPDNFTANVFSTYSGIYYAQNTTEQYQNSTLHLNEYSTSYYSSNAILYGDNSALSILYLLNFEDYGEFLGDLSGIVEGTEYEPYVSSQIQDYENAVTYSEIFTGLDNDKITTLAEDILKGCNSVCDSDIEKALALEYYFIDNGYIYDTSYQQPKDSTIDDFLFYNKTGACYEYATSMVLLARALGLPARYCEGFLINNPTGSSEPIKVTSGDAHAYPEVYISGYGWCYFEPTRVLLTTEDEQTTSSTLSQNYKLIIASLSVVVLVVLVSLFVVYVYPKLYEWAFRRKVLRSPLDVSLSLLLNRIRRLTHLQDSTTLEEVQSYVGTHYNVDITEVVSLANRVFYSNSHLPNSKELVNDALGTYVLLYDTIALTKKHRKRSTPKTLQ